MPAICSGALAAVDTLVNASATAAAAASADAYPVRAPEPASDDNSASRSAPPRYFRSTRNRSSAAISLAATACDACPKAKCGDRSSSISDPRVKFAAITAKIRSTAAAKGSAASGIESSAW